MAIKVHGPMMSPAVMRVVATLKEKDLDFELVPVNMQAGDHKKEPFISLNVCQYSVVFSYCASIRIDSVY